MKERESALADVRAAGGRGGLPALMPDVSRQPLPLFVGRWETGSQPGAAGQPASRRPSAASPRHLAAFHGRMAGAHAGPGRLLHARGARRHRSCSLPACRSPPPLPLSRRAVVNLHDCCSHLAVFPLSPQPRTFLELGQYIQGLELPPAAQRALEGVY